MVTPVYSITNLGHRSVYPTKDVYKSKSSDCQYSEYYLHEPVTKTELSLVYSLHSICN